MARRQRNGCRFLLAILTLLLIAFPALEDLARPILFIFVIAAVFVAGVVIVEPGRKHIRIAAILAVIQLILTCVTVMLTPDSTPYFRTVSVGLVTTASLIAFCIFCVLRYVLRATHVTHDQIYAGISAYLMFGFAFGCLYYLLYVLNHDSFAVNSALLATDRGPDLMYFSFVTLATLGYGDITPVTRPARVLAELEALAGMLFIAIFMARLVSLYGSGSSEEQVAAADKPTALTE